MSSFQFPANPSDGDIVVRGNLQAFYNAATNTWRVSEVPTAPGIPGPPGPPGPIGPEGKGVEISGAVDTFADLPAPNAHQFEFWIVDDTNTLYNSDGITWRDLGGPIQGPPGDPGEDGNDGTNGQNGRGWYDTNIIDERPLNYQVQFLSNDGLGFTTDNIMGPQGETGSLQVATETTLGGIKIGRGLDISPDGTATAGVTTVNLETTPVTVGTGDTLMSPYDPIYHFMGEYKTESWVGARNNFDYTTDSVTVQMPEKSNKALVFYFASSTMKGSPNTAYDSGNTRSFRLYSSHIVSLTNAVYTSGRTDSLGMAHNHNICYVINEPTLLNRFSTHTSTKFNQIEFDQGAEVVFDYSYKVHKSGSNELTGGGIQMIIIPFRDIDDPAQNPFTPAPSGTLIREGADYFFMKQDIQDVIDGIYPPDTPESINTQYGNAFREEIQHSIERINAELEYVGGTTTGDQLIAYRDQLRDARNLPGTAEEIYDYLAPILNAVNTLLDYKFRFE